jgi:16S rRNA (guanine527-N7)-methyltransferase
MMGSMQDKLHDILKGMGIALDTCVCGQLVWFLEEMLRWNKSINLTAIVDPKEAFEKHLLDALTLFPLLKGTGLLLDMGSGAGLPGIPLKLALPQLRILSVDSVHKKIVFQQHVARYLNLRAFEAMAGRLQDLAAVADYNRAFDVITARALTELPKLIPLAAPFLKDGGKLIAMKGPDGPKELAVSADVLGKYGCVAEPSHHIRLPVSGAERTLIVVKKEN